MHGQGGVDLGCYISAQKWPCKIGRGAVYNHYYCGGSGATLPSYIIYDNCIGENRYINIYYTSSCGTNGENNEDGPYTVPIWHLFDRDDTYQADALPYNRARLSPLHTLSHRDSGVFEFTFVAGQIQQVTDSMDAIKPAGGEATVTIDSTAP